MTSEDFALSLAQEQWDDRYQCPDCGGHGPDDCTCGEDVLFTDPGLVVLPERVGESARRTRLAAVKLAAGCHPLGAPLHPDAPPVDDRRAPGPRCGNCAHHTTRAMSQTYEKCQLNDTHGPATDLRLWWPGCIAWAFEHGTDGES